MENKFLSKYTDILKAKLTQINRINLAIQEINNILNNVNLEDYFFVWQKYLKKYELKNYSILFNDRDKFYYFKKAVECDIEIDKYIKKHLISWLEYIIKKISWFKAYGLNTEYCYL